MTIKQWYYSTVLGGGLFIIAWFYFPFPPPNANAILQYLWLRDGVQHTNIYITLFWTWAVALLLVSVFGPGAMTVGMFRRMRGEAKRKPKVIVGQLPPYPAPQWRPQPSIIVGEQHKVPDDENPAPLLGPGPEPEWLEIPLGGCGLGICAIGSPGSGKTHFLLTAVDQLLAWRANDPALRLGGLVLEVKGNLCQSVRDILKNNGRGKDYIEIGPKSNYCYNPLHGDSDPTELAFHLMQLMKSLYPESGGEQKFWDQAAEAQLTLLIVIHRLLYGYVTLFDIYVAAGDKLVLERLMKEADAMMAAAGPCILIDKRDWSDPDKISDEVHGGLKQYKWRPAEPNHMATPHSPKLQAYMESHNVAFDIQEEDDGEVQAARRQQYEAAKRMYGSDANLRPELVAAIAKGITVFLQVFNVDARARRLFCPPKECYDTAKNKDFKYGRPLPPLAELIETSAVLASRFPIGANENMARILGTCLKHNWQREMVLRIERKSTAPENYYRHQLLVIDEYHLLSPSRDERFLNTCREGKCIPMVAFQSLSSLIDVTHRDTWRTIFSAFATTVVFRQKDVFSAEHVSKMAGKGDQWKEHVGVTEGAHDAAVSVMTGKMASPKSSMNMSHSYNIQRDVLVEPKTIQELSVGVALVFPNNGVDQLVPRFVYLKEFGGDPNRGRFAA